MRVKSFIFKPLAWLIGLAAAAAIAAAGLFQIVFSIVYSQLPPIDALTYYKPQIPLRVYTADNVLIGEFGEERREFVRIEQIPPFVKQAILSAEDNGFYEHSGIEFSGIMRAAISNILTGRRGQGGSTITMQVARNFFLSSERSYIRKLYEVAMAYKIERHLTKDQILEVYLNQIYLGQRAYGFAAAAQVYFNKNLSDLTIGEAATIAGLPVAPSAYNPITNPSRAKMRRDYVLRRMHELGYITDTVYQHEFALPINSKSQGQDQEIKDSLAAAHAIHAEYVAEMARMAAYSFFKADTYTRGLKIYTTINSKDQQAAWQAVHDNLIAFDRRRGFRGPVGSILIADPSRFALDMKNAFAKMPGSANLVPAVIVAASDKGIRATLSKDLTVDLDADSLKFARRFLSAKNTDKKLKPGDLVYVSQNPQTNAWSLAQLPEVQSGMVSMNFETGAIEALVGGFDFYLNMFNHVTQAVRQPGSSFKPFIYSAALDKGFTPATVINDAPIFIDPRLTGNQLWEPQNDDRKFDGPMPLATALKKSKNLVSIRVMQAIGAEYAQQFVAKFGFDPSRTPAQLTTALGAGSTTPWEMVSAYSVFANGGFRVQPYLIDKITDGEGKVLMQQVNKNAGDESIRAISARNAFVMHTMLQGVVQSGTGYRAWAALHRPDMGGKTGTTNDSNDAWFAGYAGNVTTVAWVGYDQIRSLGPHAGGSSVALPEWAAYMKTAVQGIPNYVRNVPQDVVKVGNYYVYADNADSALKDLPLDGNIEQQNQERQILRDQIF